MNTTLLRSPPTTQTELVINGAAWESAVRPQLIRGPGRYAIGRVRCHSSPRRQQLFVDHIEIVEQLPSGQDRPPLDDWCCLLVEFGQEHGWRASELLRRLQPASTQSVTALVVKPQTGDSPCTWDA